MLIINRAPTNVDSEEIASKFFELFYLDENTETLSINQNTQVLASIIPNHPENILIFQSPKKEGVIDCLEFREFVLKKLDDLNFIEEM